eukprot:5873499-Pyramimonas_sp.AAC.1
MVRRQCWVEALAAVAAIDAAPAAGASARRKAEVRVGSRMLEAGRRSLELAEVESRQAEVAMRGPMLEARGRSAELAEVGRR